MSDQLPTKTVLRIYKILKDFLEPGAFSDKKFCKKYCACYFFAIWLWMLISFLNDVDCGYMYN